MKITDTYSDILTVYEGNVFHFEKWKSYIDAALTGIASSLISDVEKRLKTGRVSWEKVYLPVLNAVASNKNLREKTHDSFCHVTNGLEKTLYDRFGKCPDVNIIFYLGLCNSAGRVTEYQGKQSIFLGIEKIMELNWCGEKDMRGLIYHELGHIYQGQYGILERVFDRSEEAFLWQLFTEGFATYFEQALVGDFNYYHQDKNGWKRWCDSHFEEIKADFRNDLKSMTFANQRYFGDWVKYNGHTDVGYYLGCRFVQFILLTYKLDEVIHFDIDEVARLFEQFVK